MLSASEGGLLVVNVLCEGAGLDEALQGEASSARRPTPP